VADPSRLHFRLNGPLAPPTMDTQSSKDLIPEIFLVGKSQIKLLFVSLLNFSLDCWIPETGQASSLTDMSTFLKIMLRGDFKDAGNYRHLKLPPPVGRKPPSTRQQHLTGHLSCLLRRVRGFFAWRSSRRPHRRFVADRGRRIYHAITATSTRIYSWLRERTSKMSLTFLACLEDRRSSTLEILPSHSYMSPQPNKGGKSKCP
jgi:hypothetical protein